jgi:hypothetical protein
LVLMKGSLCDSCSAFLRLCVELKWPSVLPLRKSERETERERERERERASERARELHFTLSV